MKKLLLFPLLTFIFSSLLFSQSAVTEKKFIKGSLSEKIKIIENLEEKESVLIPQKALFFAIENAASLSSDDELRTLVKAAVKALPDDPEKIKKIKTSTQKSISENLMTVFKLFKNTELRSAVMEKLALYSRDSLPLVVSFLNDYLETAFKTDASAENVLEEAIVALGKIGNEASLTIIYNIWAKKIWPEYQESAGVALVSLAQDSFSDVIKIFSLSQIADSAHFFALLRKSSKISQNFLCEVAENAILIAINNAEKLKAFDKDSPKFFASFQLETQEVLCEHKWSHAAQVINSNVLLAKKAWNDGSMKESDFIRIIESSVRIPSQALAQSLTDMLSECNGKVEQAGKDGNASMPAKSVVLALISALGELGDKTAFDTLLFVTYLSYPLDVIDAAKASLAKLNW
ncbi:hypothetical protein [uncultured Treponema sp.]|uniref:hypothetical protein n=1 Tax=uncultured Treponema sp. TaxID=162155 RepID=UPI0025D57CF5|nr:hypothetical protein [uncultured Treponema sp.]